MENLANTVFSQKMVARVEVSNINPCQRAADWIFIAGSADCGWLTLNGYFTIPSSSLVFYAAPPSIYLFLSLAFCYTFSLIICKNKVKCSETQRCVFNGITRFEVPSAQKSGLKILGLYAYIVVVVAMCRSDFFQTYFVKFMTLTLVLGPTNRDKQQYFSHKEFTFH